ncbi:MAG TPA: arginine--tRNA ligase [Bacilli bacterium]|nr:arginine--tRNA ligase [Bacilli bacterium]
MINEILNKIKITIANILSEQGVKETSEVFFDIPKDPAFGDYSTNIAMRLAKILKKAPIVIANDIINKIDLTSHHLTKAEVAGGGFINFYIDKKYLSNVIFKILEEKEKFGNLTLGNHEKVLLEFVSANPTGYLHIGHGRGAAYGDSMARIMKKAGFDVTTEHYVNDAGNQIHNLIESIFARYKELYGKEFQLDDNSYHGKEIISIAQKIKTEKGEYYLTNPYYEYFRSVGLSYLLAGLKKDLQEFNVVFDDWFSEKSLYDNGEVEKVLARLKESGHTYVFEGATWLKTTAYTDEKDRVIIKSDGSLTYLAPDIAYHINKLNRGYTLLIDVLGADHHGYINRLKSAIYLYGGNPDAINIDILQMVRALKDGEELKMSKRSGKAITLRDLIDEVGSDALRFLYISKSLSTHMDLDLDLAIKNSNENPVYYVQYAYARINSLFRVFSENNQEFVPVKEFKVLDINETYNLVKVLLQYPAYIEEVATKRLPHKICQYALMLAGELHSYYNDHKIITENNEETNERLTLLKAVQTVLKDSLSLIGVGIKEKM